MQKRTENLFWKEKYNKLQEKNIWQWIKYQQYRLQRQDKYVKSFMTGSFMYLTSSSFILNAVKDPKAVRVDYWVIHEWIYIHIKYQQYRFFIVHFITLTYEDLLCLLESYTYKDQDVYYNHEVK